MLGLFIGASSSAHAAVSCKEFLALAPAQQHLFVSGLVDGMGTTFGVTDTFAKHLKAAAASSEEKTGIEKMHGLPIRSSGFL